MSAHQTTQTAATVSTPLLPGNDQPSASAQPSASGDVSPLGHNPNYGALERGENEDEGVPLARRESHPLRVHARDFKVCLMVFFVVCAVFLAAGILRSLGWGDEVIDEPAGPAVEV